MLVEKLSLLKFYIKDGERNSYIKNTKSIQSQNFVQVQKQQNTVGVSKLEPNFVGTSLYKSKFT